MPKILSANSKAGLEVLASYQTGPRILDAQTSEQAEVLGTFYLAVTSKARLEVIGALPFGGTGFFWFYDASPGEISNREIGRRSMQDLVEARRTSATVELTGGKLYQIRASCTDPDPTGKIFAIQGASPVDVD